VRSTVGVNDGISRLTAARRGDGELLKLTKQPNIHLIKSHYGFSSY
jgi:hypothetical protein